MTFTWLSRPREEAGRTQEYVAARLSEMGKSCTEKTIARWERGESGKNRKLPYRELAEIVGCTEARLYADHTRDLGLLDKEMAVEIAAMESALEECVQDGLTERLLKKLNCSTAHGAAEVLASILLAGEGERLPATCSGPLEQAVQNARTIETLDRIRAFVGSVAIAAVHANAGDLQGLTVIQGISEAWSIRLRVNQALEHGIASLHVIVQPRRGEPPKPRIDSDRVNAVPLPMRTKAGSDRSEDRVIELLCELGEVLGHPCADTIRFQGSAAPEFSSYRRSLDAHILQTNPKTMNAFAYSRGPESRRRSGRSWATSPICDFSCWMTSTRQPKKYCAWGRPCWETGSPTTCTTSKKGGKPWATQTNSRPKSITSLS